MGTCFSKRKENPSPPPSSSAPSTHPHFQAKSPVLRCETQLHGNLSKDLPSLLPEEETVKEVLSETQKPPLHNVETRGSSPDIKETEEKEEKIEEKVPTFIMADESSELSGITDSAENEMKPVENESPAKCRRKRPLSGEDVGRIERGGKSPSRRYDPSPLARRPTVREMGPVNQSQTPVRRGGIRRDASETSGSGRRSLSPANRNRLRKSQSRRTTSWSPCPEPAEAGGRRVERAAASSSWKESLENPSVALECFIFLVTTTTSSFLAAASYWNRFKRLCFLSTTKCGHDPILSSTGTPIQLLLLNAADDCSNIICSKMISWKYHNHVQAIKNLLLHLRVEVRTQSADCMGYIKGGRPRVDFSLQLQHLMF